MPNEFESVPLAKIEDFGAHQNQYYQLDISYFKSACDTALLNTIWNKYWVATLSSSPMLSNSVYLSSQVRQQMTASAFHRPLAQSLDGPVILASRARVRVAAADPRGWVRVGSGLGPGRVRVGSG